MTSSTSKPSRAEGVKLTEAQRRVLIDLAAGGCLFAALRRSTDFIADGVLFSESVGIVVHRPGSQREERYRVRNKTAAPLYLQSPPLFDCHPSGAGGGWRSYEITPAGRQALEASR